MILREATIKYKGYDPDKISPKSNKRICCSCNKCGRVRWISKSDYRNLCHKCSLQDSKRRHKLSISNIGKQAGRNHPNYKEKIIVTCDTCGNEVERHLSTVFKHNFCDRECYINFKDHNKSNTDIEILMQKILKEKGYNFETQVPILNYFPDILLPEYNIIIECDGDYWHGNKEVFPDLEDWQIKAQIRDKKRDEKLSKAGYTIIRFWGKDIKNNIEKCIKILENNIKLNN